LYLLRCEGAKVKIEHCIQTIASVARIKWRPQRSTQIASSSLVVDFSIYIWDYNRPFVPFASFQEHKDVTTDFVWRDDEPKRLISAGKDGTVYQHFIKDSDRTGLKINPCGLAIGVNGDLSVAFADSLLKNRQSHRLQNSCSSSLPVDRRRGNATPLSHSHTALMPSSPAMAAHSIGAFQQSNSSSNSSINTLPSASQSNPTASGFAFSAATSTSSLVKRISLFQAISQNTHSSSLQNSHVRIPSQSATSPATTSGSPSTTSTSIMTSAATSSLSLSKSGLTSPIELYSSSLFYLSKNTDDHLVECALRYELSGQSLSDLCEHNAEVAQQLDRPHVAVTWRILKQLYAGQQTQMHSHLSSTAIGLTGDDTKDELRHRHKSGHTSRHPSGSAGVASNNVVPSTPTLTATNSSNSSVSVGVGTTGAIGLVTNITLPTNIRSTHLSGSGNRRTANNSGTVGSTIVPIITSGVPSRPTSLNPTQSLALSLKLPDSDSEIESNDLLQTPTEKEFNREHQDFFFGDSDVSQSVANLTSYDIAPTDNLAHLEGDQVAKRISHQFNFTKINLFF
jgi:hypothetical protein